VACDLVNITRSDAKTKFTNSIPLEQNDLLLNLAKQRSDTIEYIETTQLVHENKITIVSISTHNLQQTINS